MHSAVPHGLDWIQLCLMNPVYWPISSSWFKQYSWSASFARDPSRCWKYWEGSRSTKKTHRPYFWRWCPIFVGREVGWEGFEEEDPQPNGALRYQNSYLIQWEQRGKWRIGHNNPTITKPKCLITYGSCAKNSSKESCCFSALEEGSLALSLPFLCAVFLLQPHSAPSWCLLSLHQVFLLSLPIYSLCSPFSAKTNLSISGRFIKKPFPLIPSLCNL